MMKKKMLTTIIIIAVVIILLLAGWYVAFCKFGVGPAFPFLPMEKVEIGQTDMSQLADNPLMALAESEEEARTIAEQYGITFVSYDNGVALYQTDEDPFQVIARGQENDYPPLSLNLARELHGDIQTPLMEQQEIKFK